MAMFRGMLSCVRNRFFGFADVICCIKCIVNGGDLV